MIKQLSVFLENAPGRLAGLARTLGDSGINMHALMVAEASEFGMVRIICDTPKKAKTLLEEAGFGASVTDVIAVEVPDAPGGLADALEVLGANGANVAYAYCFIHPLEKGAVDVLKVDSDDAEDMLTKAGFTVLAEEALYVPDPVS
ncbi:MAG: ACT domain-containing protein [Coriobacteriia bacterium]|nr:ACT domain-containing protein [Coriobacteriia bacterium]